MVTGRFVRAWGRGFKGLGPDAHGGPERPFHFVQMADTQLGMEAMFQPAGAAGRQAFGWAQELALMRRAAEEVNRLRPAFAIVCGDLVNEYPPEESGASPAAADGELRARQERDFKEVMDLVDPEIPLLCVCGNHDVGNRPNARTIRRYTDSFGDDYFAFWCHGVKCLVVNSQLWKDDSDCEDLRRNMDEWLERELEVEEGAQPRRILVFSHIPPFINEPDEKDEYFNLDRGLRHNLLTKFAAKGAVAWFCGHYHRNAGGVYRAGDGRELEVVVTGAVGTQIVDKPGGEPLGLSGIGGHLIGEECSGLRVVRVSQDGVKHEWRTFAELRASAAQAENGRQDSARSRSRSPKPAAL